MDVSDGAEDAPLIRDRMIAEHRLIETRLDELLDAFEANDHARMSSCWFEFETLLLPHLEIEEALLIPVLRRTQAREARALLEEHNHIRARAAQLGTAVDLHTARLDTAKHFSDELRAHATHEDKLFYPWADHQLSIPERMGLFAQLAAAVEAFRAKRRDRLAALAS